MAFKEGPAIIHGKIEVLSLAGFNRFSYLETRHGREAFENGGQI